MYVGGCMTCDMDISAHDGSCSVGQLINNKRNVRVLNKVVIPDSGIVLLFLIKYIM